MEENKNINAIILSVGMSTRFTPLSILKSKGLMQVKGEFLLERQIKQLLEKGVEDITLILGYRWKDYKFLIDKYDLNII